MNEKTLALSRLEEFSDDANELSSATSNIEAEKKRSWKAKTITNAAESSIEDLFAKQNPRQGSRTAIFFCSRTDPYRQIDPRSLPSPPSTLIASQHHNSYTITPDCPVSDEAFEQPASKQPQNIDSEKIQFRREKSNKFSISLTSSVSRSWNGIRKKNKKRRRRKAKNTE